MQPKTKLLLLVSVIIMIVLFACKKEEQRKLKTQSLTNIEWNTTSFQALSIMDFMREEIIDTEIYGKQITIEADEPIVIEITSKHLRLVAPN